ncbi:MAG: hypothetical protein ACRCZQ_12355 [Bacteroidales bacterium]
MLFNKKQRIFLLSAPLLFSACNDDVINDSKDDSQKEPVEVIVPVDFRCITLNHEGSGGDKPSISYVHKDGTIYANHFTSVNQEQIVPNPRSASQINDKLYVTHSSYWPVQSQKWAQNGVFVMNPNTFVCERDIDLGKDYLPYAIQSLGGDSILVVGDDKTKTSNIIIGSLDPGSKSFVKRTLNVDFPVNRVVRVGNKIVVSGNKTQSNGVYSYSKLGVWDLKSITPDQIQILVDKVNLSSRNTSILTDKYQRIWFGNESGSGYVLLCVDLKSGKLIHEVSMPLSMSSMNELALTMDNKGEKIYLRNHKAFYVISVDNPSTPDEPVFEYLAQVGSLNDLQMTQEGNLLFLNEVITPSRPSELIEVKPMMNQPWEIVKVVNIGSVARSIYVAKYEK